MCDIEDIYFSSDCANSVTEETYHCPKCGHTQDILGYVELGGFFPFNERDLDCEECGGQMIQ